MGERLTTLGLALAALLLFVTLFVHVGGPVGPDVSAPTTVDRGSDGLMGAATWLREEGVRTRSLRQRFTALTVMRELDSTGNLLIVSIPTTLPFRNDEAVALDRWIRRGNTLLVLAALADRPAWARDRGVLESDLRLLTGLEIEPDRPQRGALWQQTRLLLQPRRDTLAPNGTHRYLGNVRTAVGFSDYSPRRSTIRLPRDALPLCLAHTSYDCGLWLLIDGSGSIVVSGLSSLFSNRALGAADNGQLLANLVANSVASGGTVLFDDQHQGLSDTYDPEKFYHDRRLYLTLGILAAVWLVWVIGGTRLRPPPAPPPVAGEADLVYATGSFLARVLRPSAAARRMFEHFFLRLRRVLRQPTLDPSPYWDWLESNPRLARADVARLREWYADAYSDRRVPLVALHNLIVKTEMQLAA